MDRVSLCNVRICHNQILTLEITNEILSTKPVKLKNLIFVFGMLLYFILFVFYLTTL
jgi:hypothetical protein